MRSAVSQWLRKLRESLPEPQIFLVPGHCFYTHRFEIAPGMTRQEIDSFLGLSLEGAAPFPLEHMAWGFFHVPGESHALVYATTRQRLKSLGDLELEGFYHAFPGYVSVLGGKEERAKVRIVSQTSSVSAVFFAAGKAVPERVVSRSVTADVLTDSALLRSREQLLDEVDTSGYYVEEGLWVGEGVEINAKGQPVFRHRRIGTSATAPEPHALEVDAATLWQLDLRDDLFATKHRKERRLAQRLWTGVQAVAAGLVLLVVLQIASFGLVRATDWIDNQLLSRYARAELITKNEQFIERLASDSAQSLDPVQMLTAVNTLRPKEIFFRNAGATRTEDGRGMLLSFTGECRADAGVVNNYADALRALDTITQVDQSIDVRDGRTHFEMDVTFDPARLRAAEERVRPPVAQTSTPDPDDA